MNLSAMPLPFGRVVACYRPDHVDPALMATALEGGPEERVEDLPRRGQLGVASGERDDVGVVMESRHARELGIRDLHGAHAGHLVGRDGHAEPGAADKDAEIGFTVRHAAADGLGEHGVVDALLIEWPDVDHFVACVGKIALDLLFQGETGVVAAELYTQTRYLREPSRGLGHCSV